MSSSSRTIDQMVTSNETSRIAGGVVIRGDVSSRADIRVDGQLDGKIFSEGRITIGETANIKGSIVCTDLDLWGKIDGDIYIKNVLSVKGTAVIDGNIHVRKLQVEMGAQINGTCGMITEEDFTKMADQVVSIKLPKPKAPAPAPAVKKPETAAPAVEEKAEDQEVAATEEAAPVQEEPVIDFRPKSNRSPFSY